MITFNPGFETLTVQLYKIIAPRVNDICLLRGLWATEKIRKLRLNKFYNFIEKINLNLSTKIYANGYDTQKIYEQKNLHKRKFKVIYNGVDVNRFNFEKRNIPNKLTLIVVSTLRDIKGIPFILQCLSYFSKNDAIDYECIFLGKGDIKKYNRYIDNNNLKSHIKFLGPVINVEKYLKEAHISLCFSGGSGISHSLLEALATGLPVIALNTPTYNQIIENGVNGFLINNEKDFVNVLHLLYNDPTLYEQISQNAVRTAQKYSWEHIALQFIKNI